jgi:diacylglycerol kinase family enzyme
MSCALSQTMGAPRAASEPSAAAIAVIANDRAGTLEVDGTLQHDLEQAGIRARVHRAAAGVDVVDLARRARRDSDVLIAAGGDGTVSAVASVAVETGATFGVIPAGTLNHFARDAGIPLDRGAAVEAIKGGRTREIDVGEVNGQIFINNASLGMYPRLVWERVIHQRRGWRKGSALAIALAKAWWKYRTVGVVVRADDRKVFRRTPFLVVANGEYALDGMSLGARTAVNTGCLSIYVAPANGRFGVLTLPLRAVMGWLEAEPGFELLHTTEATLETDRRRVSVALDGEVTLMATPLRFRILPRALRTIVADG